MSDMSPQEAAQLIQNIEQSRARFSDGLKIGLAHRSDRDLYKSWEQSMDDPIALVCTMLADRPRDTGAMLGMCMMQELFRRLEQRAMDSQTLGG